MDVSMAWRKSRKTSSPLGSNQLSATIIIPSEKKEKHKIKRQKRTEATPTGVRTCVLLLVYTARKYCPYILVFLCAIIQENNRTTPTTGNLRRAEHIFRHALDCHTLGVATHSAMVTTRKYSREITTRYLIANDNPVIDGKLYSNDAPNTLYRTSVTRRIK